MPTFHYTSRQFLERHGVRVDDTPQAQVQSTNSTLTTSSTNNSHQFLPLTSLLCSSGDDDDDVLGMIHSRSNNIHGDGPAMQDRDSG